MGCWVIAEGRGRRIPGDEQGPARPFHSFAVQIQGLGEL